ncbi:MAG: DUF362 domain-containing protein [Proteobacteria bacterium]|jgi:hypothetical protein|nr:DUF362 domain-containing protein [Pseudomonadota bacterium]
MAPEVWFLTARASRFDYEDSLLGRLERALARFPFGAAAAEGEVVPIKIHFGSRGAVQTIRPAYVAAVVDAVARRGAHPFVTDTVRMLGHEYLAVANRNGYNESSLRCPVLLADGIFGNDSVEVDCGPPIGVQSIASAIHDATSMVVMSHVKGHIQAGFGGALKNLAMGGVSAHPRSGSWEKCRGKAHFLVGGLPEWAGAPPCTLCGTCERHCPMGAMKIRDGVVAATQECWRCGRCISACPEEALSTPKDEGMFQRALAAQAGAVAGTFAPGKVVYVSFLLEMQPECDCMDMCDVPMVQNVGVLIASDPVAIDAAALDLVAKAPLLPGSRADRLIAAGYGGNDPFGAVHLKSSWGHVRHAAELGLGSLEYVLKPFPEKEKKG